MVLRKIQVRNHPSQTDFRTSFCNHRYTGLRISLSAGPNLWYQTVLERFANSSAGKCTRSALQYFRRQPYTPLQKAPLLIAARKACIIHFSSQRRRGGTNVGSRSIVSSGCLRLSPPSHSTIVHPFPPTERLQRRVSSAPAASCETKIGGRAQK